MDRTFKACRTLIEKEKIEDRNEFLAKLDILMLSGRLSQKEYDFLTDVMGRHCREE